MLRELWCYTNNDKTYVGIMTTPLCTENVKYIKQGTKGAKSELYKL
jgi:carbonic anhydrase